MLRSVRPPRFDAMLALALAAAAQAEVWSGLLAGPKGATLPASLAYTLPLAWRRRAPLPVAVLVVASALIQVFASVDLDTGLSWFVAFVVAMYSLGAYGSRAPAIGGLAFAVGFTGVLLSVPDFGWGDYLLWVGILAAAPWAVGRALRSRRLQAAQLENRAARLEHEHEEQARIAVAAERAPIARELHDIVAHSVSVMVVQVGVVRRRMRGDHREDSDLLSEVEDTGRQGAGGDAAPARAAAHRRGRARARAPTHARASKPSSSPTRQDSSRPAVPCTNRSVIHPPPRSSGMVRTSQADHRSPTNGAVCAATLKPASLPPRTNTSSGRHATRGARRPLLL